MNELESIRDNLQTFTGKKVLIKFPPPTRDWQCPLCDAQNCAYTIHCTLTNVG